MIAELLDELRRDGHLQGEVPPVQPGASVSRWIAALQVAGAWLASLFLLLFVGLAATSLVRSGVGWMVLGVLATGAAALGLRADLGMIGRQFLLALSLAGQGAFALGVAEKSGWRVADAWWAVAAFETIVFIVVGWAAHRLLAGLLMLWAIQLALAEPLHVDPLVGGVSTWLLPTYWGLACGLGALEGRWRVRRWSDLVAVMGSSLLIYCLGSVLAQFVLDMSASGLLGASRRFEPLLALVSLICLFGLERSLWHGRRGWMLLGALVGLCVVTWQAPGITMGLVAVVLGFGRGRRWLLWLGGAVMIAALGRYYYFLPVGLLEKSGLLALGGFMLLALRALLNLESRA